MIPRRALLGRVALGLVGTSAVAQLTHQVVIADRDRESEAAGFRFKTSLGNLPEQYFLEFEVAR